MFLLAIFFLIGFSPWIFLNWRTHFGGFVIQGTPILECFNWKNFFKRLLDYKTFPVYELFSVFGSEELNPFTPPRLVRCFYRLLFGAPMIAAFVYAQPFSEGQSFVRRLKHQQLLSYALLHMLIFCLITQFTDFRATRFFIPVQPFLFFLSAYAVAWLEHRFSVQAVKIQRLFFCSLLFASVGIFSRMISLEDTGHALKTKGTNYAWLVISPASRNWQERLKQFQKFKDELTSDNEYEMLIELAAPIVSEIRLQNPEEELNHLESLMPSDFRQYFYYALGMEMMGRHHFRVEETMEELKFLKSRSERDYNLAILGMLSSAFGEISEPVPFTEMMRIYAKLPGVAAPYYWKRRGIEWIHSRLEDRPPAASLQSEFEQFLTSIDPQFQSYVLQGVGMFLYEAWSAQPFDPYYNQVLFLINQYPEPYMKHFFYGAGLGARIYGTGLSTRTPYDFGLLKLFKKGLSLKARQSFEEGKAADSDFLKIFHG